MSAPVLWPVSDDLALQQVGSGVRYSDHDVDVVATAAHDTEQSWTLSKHFGNAAASHPFFRSHRKRHGNAGLSVWKPPPPIGCRRQHGHSLPRKHIELAKDLNRQLRVDKC